MKSNISLFVLFFLSSCHLTESIPSRVEVVPVTKVECNQTDTIKYFFSFYAGEKIDFDYTTLAVINTANGNQRELHPLTLLKKKALEQCADGVINIQQSISQGSYSKTDLLEDSRNSTTYHNFPITSFTGLAVKLKKDSLKSTLRQDSSMISVYKKVEEKVEVEKVKCEECEAKKGGKALIIAGTIIGFIFGVLIVASR